MLGISLGSKRCSFIDKVPARFCSFLFVLLAPLAARLKKFAPNVISGLGQCLADRMLPFLEVTAPTEKLCKEFSQAEDLWRVRYHFINWPMTWVDFGQNEEPLQLQEEEAWDNSIDPEFDEEAERRRDEAELLDGLNWLEGEERSRDLR
jgi:hypothetical protein